MIRVGHRRLCECYGETWLALLCCRWNYGGSPMNDYDRNQGLLQATKLRTASLLAAILVAAAAGVTCNMSDDSTPAQGGEGGQPFAPSLAGQANGDLHSTLPDLHDMRRRFRDHHWTSAMVVETTHHQTRSSL